jgi:hypothetical protein
MNGVLNRRDIDDIVQSFKTNAASAPRRHYVNAIFASREDTSSIISNVVGNDVENQVLESTAIPATTRAAEITVATYSSTDFTTFPDVNFLDTANASFPPSITEADNEQEHQTETSMHDVDNSLHPLSASINAAQLLQRWWRRELPLLDDGQVSTYLTTDSDPLFDSTCIVLSTQETRRLHEIYGPRFYLETNQNVSL